MDTDFLYLALPEGNLQVFILPDKRDEWNALCLSNWTDTFTANATDILFPRMCCNTHKKQVKIEPGFFREEFRYTEMLSFFSKAYRSFDQMSIKYKFSSSGQSKPNLDDCGDKFRSSYCILTDESLNVTAKEGSRKFNIKRQISRKNFWNSRW